MVTSFKGNTDTLKGSNVSDLLGYILCSPGMTQDKAAHLLGVDQSTISRWVSGKHFPTKKQMVRIRRVMKTITNTRDSSNGILKESFELDKVLQNFFKKPKPDIEVYGLLGYAAGWSMKFLRAGIEDKVPLCSMLMYPMATPIAKVTFSCPRSCKIELELIPEDSYIASKFYSLDPDGKTHSCVNTPLTEAILVEYKNVIKAAI